jgi:hypothetical protein
MIVILISISLLKATIEVRKIVIVIYSCQRKLRKNASFTSVHVSFWLKVEDFLSLPLKGRL